MASGLEGVTGQLQRMRLSEEKKGVRVGSGAKGKTKATDPQAVGRLLSEKSAAPEFLERELGGAWCPKGGLTCREMAVNTFLFTFPQASGKRKALEEGPWMFNRELVVMIDFEPMKTPDELEFIYTPCWVRVLKMPMGLMDRDTAELIGEDRVLHHVKEEPQ